MSVSVTGTDTRSLVIVRPKVITPDNLVSTNLAFSDYEPWSPTKDYAKGDRIASHTTLSVYESLTSENTGNDPLSSGSTDWVRVGPVNQFAAFDASTSTATVSADDINYVINPGQSINCVSFLDFSGVSQITVTLRSGQSDTDPVVYQKVINTGSYSISSSWWGFFFGQRFDQRQAVLLDLPNYPDCRLEIEIKGSGNIAIGTIVIGQNEPFGKGVELGARVGIQDYSRKETNEFGDTVLVKRAFAKRANFDLMIGKGEVDALQNFLAMIRAEPVLWVGTTEYEATVLFGFYRTFEILISYPTYSMCELQIEGLT